MKNVSNNCVRVKGAKIFLMAVIAMLAGFGGSQPASGQSCVSPPANLVSWWRAESNTVDSISGNNATIHGGVTFASGEVGQAFNFSGATSTYLSCAPSASLNVGTSSGMSIELWIKPTQVAIIQALAEWNDGTHVGSQFLTSESDGGGVGALYVNLLDTSGMNHIVHTGPGVLNTSNLQHVAMTYDKASGTARIYYNGSIVASQILGNFTPQTSYQLNFGERISDGGSLYAGLMDEISIYNRALGSNEIQAIFNAGPQGKCVPTCTPPSAGLVSWWKAENNTLDQTSGNTGVWFGTAAYAAGEVGTAFKLDGSSHVRIPDSPSLHFTNMTAEAWVNPSLINGSGSSILCKYDGALGVNQSAFSFGLDGSGFGSLLISIDGVPSDSAYAQSTNVIPVNQWTHLAGTYDGTNIKYYVNGTLQAIVPLAGRVFAGTDDLAIGANIGGIPESGQLAVFNGLIDEPTLYSRALSGAEIMAIYNASFAGKCTSPTAPTITSQPHGQTVPAGTTVTFMVGASGTAPLSYQWKFGNSAIPGATASSLVLTNVQTNASGNYSVVVSNVVNSVTSSNALLTVTPSASCTPPPAGLVSWWAGESNTVDQVSGNNGSWFGTAAYSAGEVNTAFNFNGSSHVHIADSPSLHFTTMTAEAWVNPASINGAGNSVMVKYDAIVGVNQSAFSFGMDGSGFGSLLISTNGTPGGSAFAQSTNVIPTNQWTHLAGTYDGTNIKFYVNGTLQATVPLAGRVFPGTDNLAIGANIGAVSDSGHLAVFNGLIDEPSLYDRALSAAEIAAIYNAGAAGKCAQAVAPSIANQPQSQTVNAGSSVTFTVGAAGSIPLAYQWNKQGSGAIGGATNSSLTVSNVQLADSGTAYFVVVSNSVSSATSSNAILTVNPPTCVPAPSNLVSWLMGEGNTLDPINGNNATIHGGITFAPGEVGQAFNFPTSSNTYLSCAPSASLNVGTNSGMSIELWVKPTQVAIIQILAEWNDGTHVGSQFLTSESDGGGVGALYINLLDTNGNNHIVHTGPGVLNTSSLQHVAMTYDKASGMARIYYNGSIVASQILGNFTPQTSYQLNFGERISDGGSLYAGLMDEISIYSRALSSSEIQAIYNAGTLGKCFVPVAPTITSQPHGQTVPAGTTVTFAVGANGTQPLSYQWKFGNSAIPGATTSSLVLTNVQTNASGNYSVVVSNTVNSVTSSNALLTVTPAPSCTPPPAALVSWWRAESNTVDSISGNTATWSGTPAYSAGEVGTAFNLNGSGNYLRVPDAPNLRFTTGMTAEAWVNLASLNFANSIMVKFDAVLGINQSAYSFSLDNVGHAYLLLNPTGNDGITSGVAISSNAVPLNTWTHVAGTYDGSNIVIYVNGVPRGSAPFTNGIFPGTEDLGIGANIGGGVTALFNGLIDEPSLYNRALSAAEIAAIYNAGAAGKCVQAVAPSITSQPQGQTVPVGANVTFNVGAGGSTPLSYQWKFGSAPISGATTSSLNLSNVQISASGNYSVVVSNGVSSVTSSNALLAVVPVCVPAPANIVSWWAGESNTLDRISGNNGTWSGTPTYSTGEVGTAFHFNGTSTYVRIPDSTSLHFTTAMTAEAWINPSAFNPNSSSILVKYDAVLGPSQASFGFSLTSDGRPYLLISTNGVVQANNAAASNAVPLNQWTHVAGVYDGSNILIYVNGVLQGSAPLTGSIFPGTDDLAIGANVGGVANGIAIFNGFIDEPSLYNRGLSAAEIRAIYNAGSAGKCFTPVAPTITSQPQSQTVPVGTNVTFTVGANGTQPLSYQWKFGSTTLSNATTSSLTLSNVQAGAAGNYSVVVSNVAGSVTSSNALLTILSPPPPCTPPSAGIVSWWAGESNTLDRIGGNTGVWSGTPTYAPGEVGKAFQFDGSSRYVRVPDSASLRFTTGMTAEAWINPASINYANSIMVKYDAVLGINQAAFSFSLDNVGHAYLLINSTGIGGDSGVAISSNAVPLNTWTHVAGTYDGSNIVIYVNGVPRGSAPFAGGIFPGTDDLGIGANIGGGVVAIFNGLIDEPSLYNRGLSAAEVAAIYNAGSGGKCVQPVGPSITSQPQSQTVGVGTSVTFTVGAAGSTPLAYQWNKLGSGAIGGATNSSLTISNVQPANSGSTYFVVVSNSVSSVTSSNAILTVSPQPTTLQIVSITAPSNNVTVPINLISQGTENTLGFSINFNNSVLNFLSADAGNVVGATLIVNSNQASSGKVGLALSLAPNATFAPGTDTVANLYFSVVPATSTNTLVTSLTFGDQPILRQVYDPSGATLPAGYSNGTVTIPFAGFEGDVFPLPNGDAKVLLNDWLQVGRFVAGVDPVPNPGEFQRADCAPRSTLGDGHLTVADWVQAGRYAAGLDPLTAAGGPDHDVGSGGSAAQAAGSGASAQATGRTVTVIGVNAMAGQTCRVPVQLASQGNENALEFSIALPPACTFVSASVGADAAGATLILNTNQIASGNLGVVISLPIGASFSPGNLEVLKLTLNVASNAAGPYSISLISQPLPQEISDSTANTVSANYMAGTLAVTPISPTLSAARVPGGFSFSWPTSASGFHLESTTSLNPPNWTNAAATLVTNGNTITATSVPSGPQTFFRLTYP